MIDDTTHTSHMIVKVYRLLHFELRVATTIYIHRVLKHSEWVKLKYSATHGKLIFKQLSSQRLKLILVMKIHIQV